MACLQLSELRPGGLSVSVGGVTPPERSIRQSVAGGLKVSVFDAESADGVVRAEAEPRRVLRLDGEFARAAALPLSSRSLTETGGGEKPTSLSEARPRADPPAFPALRPAAGRFPRPRAFPAP